jgi:hypothetical protein
MTLVLSLITESWAIQVSDRRLVWLDPANRVIRKDDERNKAVVWCNRLAFAYTGLAELGPMREATDAWLSRELAENLAVADRSAQSQDLVVSMIADRATAAMKRPRIARGIPAHQRRHAFVGVGWARFAGEDSMSPYVAQIHNFPQSSDPRAPAADEFGIAISRLPEGDKQISVKWIGQDLDEPATALLEELKRGDPQSREYGSYAASVMVEIVRTVAASNEFVGRGLLINSLPRWAIHPGQTETFLLAGAPHDEQLSFLHIPHDKNDPVIRGPRYVCEGRQMANFRAWEPTADEIAQMLGPDTPS